MSDVVSAELTPAAIALLGLLAALLLHDYVSLEKHRRLFLVQVLVFLVGGSLIVFPEIARRLAHAVGIGRGVDFVIYPLVIWLVRETLLTRRRRHADDERMTELVRALAASGARVLPPSERATRASERDQGTTRAESHSPSSSAS